MKRLVPMALLMLPCFALAAEAEFTMIRFFDLPPTVKQKVGDEIAMGEFLKKSQSAVRQKLKEYKLGKP